MILPLLRELYLLLIFLIKYLNVNPDAKAEVIGYTDEMGMQIIILALSRKSTACYGECLGHSGIWSPNRLRELVLDSRTEE